jgi:potassium-transporting ATPase KdpC subunit
LLLMLAIALPALRASLVAWVLCGIVYPFAITGLGQCLLPFQANGSLATAADGTVLGSRLIGQEWDGPEWFHGRPSATVGADSNDPAKSVSAPYNAANSGGSNLGPTSKVLAERLHKNRETLEALQPELAGRLLPADMVTASGSGLDPDISPADAALQATRVAQARGVAITEINTLLRDHITGRGLGIFGEPRVNVLDLNLALDEKYPRTAASLRLTQGAAERR